jgi:hypothetical protein
MANRYAVPFQSFITNGAVITSDVTGRVATAGNTTLTLATTGGGGTFTITLGSGCTGTVTSGTATITGSPLALVAGANTVTSNGAGTCTLNLTLGTAANTNTANTWSATSGGVSGASIPTSADNFYADANSFTAASQVLTVDAAANCLNMDWTGATNSPTFAGTQNLTTNGNITFIAAMTNSYTGFWVVAGTAVLISAGQTIGSTFYTIGMISLGDNYTGTRIVVVDNSFTSNNYTITLTTIFDVINATAKTITLGSSTVVTAAFDMTGGGVVTITANTATINISGTGALAAGNVNYNGATFNFTGTAHTLSGSPTGIAALNFQPAGAQTITATGASFTVATARRTGTGRITIINGTFTKTGGSTISLALMSISGSTATPGGTWVVLGSTNGGGNSGWVFQLPIVPKLLAAGVI